MIESDIQKKMVESGFGRRFHDLNDFEVQVYVLLEFITYLRDHRTFWGESINLISLSYT